MRVLARFCACFLLTMSSPLTWAAHLPLLPEPQRVQYGSGVLKLEGIGVTLSGQAAPEDRFASQVLAVELQTITGHTVPVTSKPNEPGISLVRTGPVDALPANNETPGPESHESYQIRVTPGGAEIKARSSAGLYYGV